MNPLWNEDGTPKRPVWSDADHEKKVFAALASDEAQDYTNYARLRAEAKANTPAGVGDIVHYWHGLQCLAAIVAKTGDFQEDVDMLYVFSPEPAESGVADALHSESRILDTWHWPESL